MFVLMGFPYLHERGPPDGERQGTGQAAILLMA